MFEPAALSARLEQIILANAKRTFLTVERTHPGWHAIAQKPPRSDFGAYPCEIASNCDPLPRLKHLIDYS